LDTKGGGSRGSGSRPEPIYLLLRSLRGLDLNQRPLGYESSVSRSPQEYPLVTGSVRSSKVMSDHLSQTHFGTQESANRIASTRNLTGLPSIHMGERPLPTSFNPETGEARATLERDLRRRPAPRDRHRCSRLRAAPSRSDHLHDHRLLEE
jgi:hypothetical protein